MEIIPVFAKAIAKFKREIPLSVEELKAVDVCSKKVRRNQDNSTSIDSNILDMDEFFELKKFIMSCVQEYFDKIICPDGQVQPFITMSWMNFTEKNGSHHKHVHSNSLLSGVFYISAKKENDQIWFYKPGYERIDLTSSNLNPFNAPSWWLPVESNEIVLFPSDLEHSVPSFNEDYTRISIAFNIFVRGKFGDKEQLKWINL